MTTSATTTKPPTYPQRAGAAAVRVNERFGFADEKRMLAALAETALEEMNRNPSFAVRVRNRYEELAPQKKTTGGGGTGSKGRTSQRKLVPIKELPGFELDATRRLDPWFIIEYFGKNQLETALRIQTLNNLRRAFTVVEQRYPGTAPAGKVSKDEAIAYILTYALK